MSPKVAIVTPLRASSMAASMQPGAVTQTGHPGPLISATFGGKQLAEAVPRNGHGMAAAHLHHVRAAATAGQRGAEFMKLLAQNHGDPRIAKGIDVVGFHKPKKRSWTVPGGAAVACVADWAAGVARDWEKAEG